MSATTTVLAPSAVPIDGIELVPIDATHRIEEEDLNPIQATNKTERDWKLLVSIIQLRSLILCCWG